MVSPNFTGKDFNFYQKFNVQSATFLPNADMVINIKWQRGLSIINEGNVVVEYSFNGNIVHGDLTPNTDSSGFVWDNRSVGLIWFRVPNGGTAVVRVEAWAGV